MISEGSRSSAALLRRLPTLDELLAVATEAASLARAPYSGYRVGAAVIDDRGRITGGCNVESGAYGATICAERGAIAGAVATGATSLTACLTVTADEDPASCCGICRQLLSEFGPDLLVANASLTSDRVRWGPLRDWLPFGFALDHPTSNEAEIPQADG